MTPPAETRPSGLPYALAAYGLWGLLPLYFRAMAGATALEILAHRVIWSVAFLAVLTTVLGRWPRLAADLRRPRTLGLLTATAALIACNWLIFILAVQHGHVLEASLGYFINPLVNVLLGMVFLRERLRPLQGLAVALAAGGVLILALGNGGALWVPLSLAVSFALYGLLRKVAHVDALEGLAIETALLAPLALGWFLLSGPAGMGHLPPFTIALLLLAGPLTALPLLFFAIAARRMPYSTLGLIQYLAPTTQFLTAVLLFGEAFRPVHALTFGAIWAGLLIYALDTLRASRT